MDFVATSDTGLVGAANLVVGAGSLRVSSHRRLDLSSQIRVDCRRDGAIAWDLCSK